MGTPIDVCSTGRDPSVEGFPTSDGCSQECEHRTQRVRRQMPPAQEAWENSSSQLSGRPGLGTPTTTSSSGELEAECRKEGILGRDFFRGEHPAPPRSPSSSEGRPFKAGCLHGNVMHGIEEKLLPGERVDSFAELACYLRDLPPKNEVQARALVSGEAKVQPPCKLFGPDFHAFSIRRAHIQTQEGQTACCSVCWQCRSCRNMIGG